MILVLQLIMNGGFSFDSANRVFRFFPGFIGKSLVIAVRSSTKRNNKTRSCTWAKRIYIWQLLSSCRPFLGLAPPFFCTGRVGYFYLHGADRHHRKLELIVCLTEQRFIATPLSPCERIQNHGELWVRVDLQSTTYLCLCFTRCSLYVHCANRYQANPIYIYIYTYIYI